MKLTKLASFITFTFVVLMVAPVGVISILEGWTYLQGIYYCVITLTTIGFGDLTPGLDNVSNWINNIYLVFIALWILLGLSCMFVIIEEVQQKVQEIAEDD